MLAYLVMIALGLFGAFFTGAAVLKLSRHSHMVDEFAKMKLPYTLAYLSGGVELLMGPSLIVGIWLPGVAGVAAAVMFCTMLGAALVNLIGRGAHMAIGVLVIFAAPMAWLASFHFNAARTMLGL